MAAVQCERRPGTQTLYSEGLRASRSFVTGEFVLRRFSVRRVVHERPDIQRKCCVACFCAGRAGPFRSWAPACNFRLMIHAYS